MAIDPFQRLRSNPSTVFLGTDREQAAMNAANNTGDHPGLVPRFPTWPSLKKFDNDDGSTSFSPFGGVPNPRYIWDKPTTAGQTAAFAIASKQFTTGEGGDQTSFSVFLAAFADNAMEAKIELFEEIGGAFVKAASQPAGLGDVLFVAGEPNTPAVGVTETKPFNWQDIREYSTRFIAPILGTFKIVVSFEVTNYLPTANNPNNPNPAGLQFVVDIYAENGGNGGNVTVTSGPIFRNANTSFIQVSIQNVTDSPQTVTVSILNWQNMCPPEEFPKFGFLCGEIVNEPENGNGDGVTVQNGVIFFPPVGFIPVLTPFTFTIPARQLFSVQAYPPDPILPPNPIYEVNVTHPVDPILPVDPIRVNTWGIDGFGVIQTGNTVLHHQFTRLFPTTPI